MIGGYRLPQPENCPQDVHDLMMKCWEEERTERPSFNDLCGLIDAILSKLNECPAYGLDICGLLILMSCHKTL